MEFRLVGSIPRFVGGALLAVALMTTAGAQSGTPRVARDINAKPVDPASRVPAGSPRKDLVVHGWWTIVVKNADGSIASKTEFENSLFDGGFTFGELMNGSMVTSTWGIVLGTASTATSPCGNSTCLITTSATTGPGGALCTQLQAQQTTSCYGGLSYTVATTFQLVGQFTATQAGKITSVGTYGAFCASDQSGGSTSYPMAASTISPSTCLTSTPYLVVPLTSATSTTTPAFSQVTVTSGQTVQVTVAVSVS